MSYQTVTEYGKYREYLGNDGVNDEDVCIETVDVSRFRTFMLSCSQGAVKVEAHDGQQWLTAPISLADLGATDTNPVTQTAALRQYGFRGHYKRLRVTQEGATAAQNVVLVCSEK